MMTKESSNPAAVKDTNAWDKINAETTAMVFYDIESLDNLFSVVTLAIAPVSGLVRLDVYYLIDDANLQGQLANPVNRTELTDAIIASNPALATINLTAENINFYDLTDYVNIIRLAHAMSVSGDLDVHNPQPNYLYQNQTGAPQQFYYPHLRPVVTDTNPFYDPTALSGAICAGYNSYNYDTTMLALYFARVFSPYPDANGDPSQGIFNPEKQPNLGYDSISAAEMRQYNDQLFAQSKSMVSYLYNYPLGQHPADNNRSMPAVIRNNMIKSGRHIDVARFNEVQAMTGLKRHLGQLGHQLLESDKLAGDNATISTWDDLRDLISYNVSDVMGLKLLFDEPLYANSFNQRVQLLATYQECVYKKQPGAYAPDISPASVDPWRLTIDSSSAQFVARVLAPYSKLNDLPTVSFNYPHPDVAAELGIKPVNVLDEAKRFFDANVTDPDARAQFNNVYSFYKSVEGKNFNPGVGNDAQLLEEIPTLPNNLPYFRSDGSGSTGFVTFSTGGIHGAEFFQDQYLADCTTFNAKAAKVEHAKQLSGSDPLVMKEIKSFEFNNPHTGEVEKVKRSDVLVGVTSDNPTWKEIKAKPPVIFKQVNSPNKPENKATRLSDKYKYTSMGDCIHEDFTSYYPLLLKNMRAFYNPELGEDRYSQIFAQKEHYGKLLKDKTISQAERDNYAVLRNGAKLLLNAASGAGDARHNNNIRMNNRIISMRIIGQLFLWRIGQAQTLAGATIISTNTDGIYSAGIDPELNNAVLNQQQQHIHVDIEPENLTLVSKDSNNRVEFYPAQPGDNDRTVAAAGGALACWNGPNPSKRLTGQAITQYVIVDYFKRLSLGLLPNTNLTDDIDPDIIHNILAKAHSTMDTPKLLTMYQMLVNSSAQVGTHLYRTDYVSPEHSAVDEDVADIITNRNPSAIGKNNRIFIVKPEIAAQYGAKVYNIAAAKGSELKPDADRPEPDPLAEVIYRQAHVSKDFARKRKLFIGKCTGLDPQAPVIIHNHSMHHPPKGAIQPEHIVQMLDLDAYADIAQSKFNSDWRNLIR